MTTVYIVHDLYDFLSARFLVACHLTKRLLFFDIKTNQSSKKGKYENALSEIIALLTAY